MSFNTHGLPSRVRAIAEIGRLLGDVHVAPGDKRAMLDLLVQDHVDLDEVEALSALWAIGQAGDDVRGDALEALLACAPRLMQGSDAALLFLDLHERWAGPLCRRTPSGDPGVAAATARAFACIERLALFDAELAARLALLR
jgi:hypothetical protein